MLAKEQISDKQSPLYKAITYVQQHRCELTDKQNQLLKTCSEQYSDKFQDLSAKQLNDNVLKKIESSFEYFEAFNAKVKEYQSTLKQQGITDSNQQIHYSLSTNKMLEVLSGARKILQDKDEDYLAQMLSDKKLPYDNHVHKNLYQQEYHSSPKSTFTSGLLILTAMELSCFDQGYLKNGVLTHFTRVPTQFKLLGHQNWEYRYQDMQGVGFVHNGYAFGSAGFDNAFLRDLYAQNQYQDNSLISLYDNVKKLGPHDCSSWIGYLYGGKRFSTADLLARYNFVQNEKDRERAQKYNWNIINKKYVPEGWIGSEAEMTIGNFIAVTKDEFIKSGDIFVVRTFKEKSAMENSLGTGGHVGIVLEYSPCNQGSEPHVSVLSASRDMENGIDGYIIQKFPVQSTDAKFRFFLKDSNFNGQQEDLSHVTSMVNQELGGLYPDCFE